MTIKGLVQLPKHVPELNTPLGALRFLSLAILLAILVTVFFTTASFIQPIWLLVSEVMFGGLGFLLLYQFFRFKKEYKSRYGPLAYSKAASRFALPGVAIMFAVVAQIRNIPGPEFPTGWWHIILTTLGWALVAIGLLLFLRTLLTFGIDNLVMLYVYFPEESRFVHHRIYTILRHPAYSAAQHIAYGLALLNGNWLALACAFVFSLGIWGWVRLVEEKELIERFGPAYSDYRQRVPAFWPHLGEIQDFFQFLIAGK